MSFLSIVVGSVFMAYVGSHWIDRLYTGSPELSFLDKVLIRSRYRKQILFPAFVILFNLIEPNYFKYVAIYLLVLITVTDFEQYMIFDWMTGPLALFGAVYAWLNDVLLWNFIAAVIGGGIFLLLAIISKGAIGGGDVKLIFGLGMLLGVEKLFDVILTGAILGGATAILLLLTKEKDRKSYFAYGPYFALPAIYTLCNT